MKAQLSAVLHHLKQDAAGQHGDRRVHGFYQEIAIIRDGLPCKRNQQGADAERRVQQPPRIGNPRGPEGHGEWEGNMMSKISIS
eukprot:890885-Pelagomonas_calceolata.AAC.1